MEIGPMVNRSMRHTLAIVVIICLQLATHLLADDVYLKDGSVFRNVHVIDTVAGRVRCLTGFGFSSQLIPLDAIAQIDYKSYDKEKASVFEEPTDKFVVVKTLSGEKIVGLFIGARGDSAVYSTRSGERVVPRSHIVDVERLQVVNAPPMETRKQTVTVNDYSRLPLALPAIGGIVYGIILLDDAAKLQDAIDIAKRLGLASSTGDAVNEQKEKEIGGIALVTIGAALMLWAVIPDQVEVDRSLSVLPTSRGASLFIAF